MSSLKYEFINLTKKVKGLYKKIILRERRKSYGNENPDKIFYVISSPSPAVGLFSYVLTFSGKIKYALDKGYIPVIDMQSKPNTYLEKDQVGKVNAWEFYFEQPCGYTLDDIRKSKNVIIASGELPEDYPKKTMSFLTDKERVSMWQRLFKQYIRLNEQSLNYVEKIQKELFPNKGEKVLGVLSRGTDYIQLRPYQHPIQPDPKDMINKAQEIMNDQGGEYIYLATEDETIYDLFKATFGEKLLSLNVERYRDTGNKKYITQMESDRENDKYYKGLEYLATIELLSRCNYILAGRVGGSVAALVLSNGYEYEYFYDLGSYGIDDIK